ncbi:MAG TPA: protein phosphatase CheZ [Thermodesulfovibrionales bacterium]|nr:protein phosphatase CheZ [Thermodesulfovibrionales bacterium]
MQYIGFQLNGNEYSIPILKVREIIKTPSITRMPQSPDYMEGITNIRGNVIPVIDLKKLIHINGNGGTGENVIVVSSGKIIFGVLVDGITGVINVDASIIEPAEKFMSDKVDQIEGIAKLSDRMVVLLDSKKLLPLDDISLFDEYAVDIQEKGEDTVEVTKTVQTMAGEMKVRELHDAKDYFERKGIEANDPRYLIMDDIIGFLDSISAHDYEKADKAVQNIIKKGQSDIFTEVGKITRKLHDSLKSFKEAIDPRVKEMATIDMPNAIDRLQYVIDQTEAAANKTLGIVEKYILHMDDLAAHIRSVNGPEGSVKYLKDFKNTLEDDLTEIITTQSFQDLTGQIIKKVISLVGDLEAELVHLIATFGVKIEQTDNTDNIVPEKVTQNDVNDLLKEFGF